MNVGPAEPTLHLILGRPIRVLSIGIELFADTIEEHEHPVVRVMIDDPLDDELESILDEQD